MSQFDYNLFFSVQYAIIFILTSLKREKMCAQCLKICKNISAEAENKLLKQ